MFKLNINRRSFLKASAAAPIAARVASASMIAQGVVTSGMGFSPMAAAGMAVLGQAPEPQVPSGCGDPSENRLLDILGHLRLFGVPKWKLREHKRWARQSRVLDPDIAMMRSVSLQGKLNMQWKRNEAQYLKDTEQHLLDELDRTSWFRINRVGWW